MTTLSEILNFGGYSLLHDLHLIISLNNIIQTEQNQKKYHRIKAIEAFELKMQEVNSLQLLRKMESNISDYS